MRFYPHNKIEFSLESRFRCTSRIKLTLVIRFLVLVFSLEVWSYPDSFSGFWISVSDIEILELGIVRIVLVLEIDCLTLSPWSLKMSTNNGTPITKPYSLLAMVFTDQL